MSGLEEMAWDLTVIDQPARIGAAGRRRRDRKDQLA